MKVLKKYNQKTVRQSDHERMKNWSKCHKGAESKKSTHICYKVMVETLYNSVMVKKGSIRYTKYSRKAWCLGKTNIT